MNKKAYESPELDILWFQSEQIFCASITFDEIPGDGVVDDDEDW